MTQKETPEVSILISVFNQLDYTKRCFEELEKTLTGKISYEIIVVDDCSQEETTIFLRSLGKPFRVYFNESNKGYAINNNFAARKAEGQYLCFLNNDVFVQGNWLLPMLNVLKTQENVGIVGNVQRLASWKRYDHMGVVFSPKGKPRHYGQFFLNRSFKGEIKKWSAVTAACCVTSKQLFIDIGGFDEIFKNGCEDVDLCLRMAAQGKAHYVVHDSVVLHVKGASEGRKIFNDKNSQFLLKRWGPKIVSNQSILDQNRHAWTYLCRGLLRPWSVNFSKWLEALFIYLRIKKLG